MHKLKTIAFGLTLAWAASAQQQSESVIAGSASIVTRIVTIAPAYSDTSAKTLLSIDETIETFVRLPDGKEVSRARFTRQWTADQLAALPNVWTNKNAVVITNNPFKTQMQALWTRLDVQPERTASTITHPGMLYISPTPPPDPLPE